MVDNSEEKNREFGVLLEDIDSNVKHIAEAVDTHTEQLHRLENRMEGVEGKMERVEVRLERIETLIDNDYKQRIEKLETKVEELRDALAMK